jgi:O-antigen chain-terminating methyltransferase
VKIINPEYTVERIAARMKDAATRKDDVPELDRSFSEGVGSSERLSAAAPLEGRPSLQQIALQPPFQPHADDRYHINDLLKYHDKQFIQNAYRAILKRDPDRTGYSGFIEGLRNGRLNKIDVLARLRYSSEGRAKKVQTEGLIFPALIRMGYRLPILGYLLHLIVAFLRLPTMIRNQQQFESHVLAQMEIVAGSINQAAQDLQVHNQRISILANEQQSSRDLILARLTELTDYFENKLSLEKSEREQQALQRQQELQQEREWRQQELQEEREWRQQESDQRLRENEERQRENEARQREIAKTQQDLVSLSDNVKQEVDRMLQKQQQVNSELTLQNERLTVLLEEARNRLPAPFDEAQLQTFALEETRALDALYASFDEHFRGSKEEIKERLKVYLPIVTTSGNGKPATPILDLGCGRGEWLELLNEESLTATGIDSNRILVEQCRKLGLEVVEADLLNYLRTLPDASLGGLTGFHIVEHLSIEVLVKLIDEAMRVLRPGGVVIFETPNPQNVLVGSCNFYFDPTHRNPLPYQVLKFLVEARGFVDVKVLNLHPSDDTPVEGDSDLAKRFNRYFYGPMDYGLVAWKIAGVSDR